jgi:hypothetical protein
MMNTLKVEDLPQSRNFDKEAMVEIVGSGLWSNVKKSTRKAGRLKRKGQVSRYKMTYYGGPDTVEALF